MISFEDFSLLFDPVSGEPEFEILFRDTKKNTRLLNTMIMCLFKDVVLTTEVESTIIRLCMNCIRLLL